VEVLQARYDLPEIVADLWLRQRVSGLPDVREGLRGDREGRVGQGTKQSDLGPAYTSIQPSVSLSLP